MAAETGAMSEGTVEDRDGRSLLGASGSRSTRPRTTVADLYEEVRHRQQARLERKAADRGLPRGRRRPWAHVTLAELFREAGNVVHETSHDRELETGHQPFHGSKSGRSVRIDTASGLWYCRGCRRGGDALTYWMARYGLSRTNAAEQLAARYGAPRATRPRPRLAVAWTEL